MAFCRPSWKKTHKAASTFTPMGFSFSHIGGEAGPHTKHCLELQRRARAGLDPYTASDPNPNFSLVLWHEEGDYPKNSSDLADYLDDLLSFATYLKKSKSYPTRFMLTVGNLAMSEDLLALIASTLEEALTNGLSIGIQLGGYPNSPSPSLVIQNLKSVLEQMDFELLAEHQYLIGCDSENFIYAGYEPKANAANLSTFASSIMKDIADAGISVFPTQIAVAGGAAAKPSWKAPLVNVYELYSQNPEWNSIIAGYNPTGSALVPGSYHQLLLDLQGAGAFKSTISTPKVPGWYALDLASGVDCPTSSCETTCIQGKYFPSKKNSCGSFNVFGEWKLPAFLAFLDEFASFLRDSPTFVLYQGPFVPESWLDTAKGYSLLDEPFLADPLDFILDLGDSS